MKSEIPPCVSPIRIQKGSLKNHISFDVFANKTSQQVSDSYNRSLDERNTNKSQLL